jgi:3-deoxy-D-manno-octulosonic-acid transferase
MGPSLSLAAYRAIMRRGPAPTYAPSVPRPDGEVIWVHATSPNRLTALVDLGARLSALRGQLHVLITYDPEKVTATVAKRARVDPKIITCEALPGDHPTLAVQFLEHWQPDACVWTGGFLRPILILDASSQNIPMFLIDAHEDGFDGRKDRWFPEVSRRVLSEFSAIFAQTPAACRKLEKIGVPQSDVVQTNPLLPSGHILPCNEDDLDDMSSHLSGRPVWLAAEVQPEEIAQVLNAHRQAARLAHRLLLTIVPARPDPTLQDWIIEQGFRVTGWKNGPLPDELTQVVVANGPQDLGLWYRLAPLAFIGSSLVPGHGGRDPFDAAAFGSAVLYGPNVGDFLDAYSRLSVAGAARIVKDADGLGTAVLRLNAPDVAATMAHAGWEVVSEGADLTNKVIDLVQDALDKGYST